MSKEFAIGSRVIHLRQRKTGTVVVKDDVSFTVAWNDTAVSTHPIDTQFVELLENKTTSTTSTSPIREQPYYSLFPEHSLQVKDVNERLLDKIEKTAKEPVSLHEASWLVQALQYLFRAPFKGTMIQDIEKAIEALNIVLKSMKERQKT